MSEAALSRALRAGHALEIPTPFGWWTAGRPSSLYSMHVHGASLIGVEEAEGFVIAQFNL